MRPRQGTCQAPDIPAIAFRVRLGDVVQLRPLPVRPYRADHREGFRGCHNVAVLEMEPRPRLGVVVACDGVEV